MRRIRGSWLNNNLAVLVRALNGEKLIMVYGKISRNFRYKLKSYGFEYNQSAQRWERKVGKTARIPNFLKEK